MLLNLASRFRQTTWNRKKLHLFLTTRKTSSYNSEQMIKSTLKFWWICTITVSSVNANDMGSSENSSDEKTSFFIYRNQEQTIELLGNSYHTK